MRFARTFVLALLSLSMALSILCQPLGAQTIPSDPTLEMGFKPFGGFDGGNIDTVNLMNRALDVHIPLASYPQRGGRLSLSFSVIYKWPLFRSRYAQCVANQFAQCAYVSFVPWSGLQIVEDSIPGSPSLISPSFSIGLPDGQTTLGVPAGTNSGVTADGSGLVANYGGACTPQIPIYPWTVQDKQGNVYSYPCNGAVTAQDLNGNQISTPAPTSSGPSGPYTDTVGRTVPNPYPFISQLPTTTDTTGCTGNLPTSVVYLWTIPALNGGTVTFKVCTAVVNASLPGCSIDGTTRCDDSQASTSAIQSIVLPNRTAWTFQYDSASAPGVGGPNYGDLIGITLPTGGTISYVWQTPNLPCSSLPFTRALQSRTTNANDGSGPHTTTYSAMTVGTASFPPIQTTVLDPLGNQSVHTFTALGGESCDYYETLAQYYQGTQTLLKTVSTQYHYDVVQTVAVQGGFKAINVMPTSVTTTWPNGQTSQVQNDYLFDVPLSGTNVTTTYGNVVARREYDYGSGAPGGLIRQTSTIFQYQNSASYKSSHLVTLPATVTITNGSGTQVAQTTYGYDESNGSPQGTFGNQTSVTQWLNGGTAPKSQTVFNSQGMPSKTIDPNGNPTSFTYDSTGAFLTQVQYPTTGTVQHIEKFYFDTNTGLLLSDTDQNNNTTSYKYNDPQSRLTEVDFPDGGQTLVSYNDALPLPTKTTSLKRNTQGQLLTVVSVSDGLARTVQTQLTTDPGGTDYVDTTYDALGRIFTQSNPHRSASAPTDGKTTFTYDALGRTCVVAPPTGTPQSSCPSGAIAGDVVTVYAGRATEVLDEGNGTQSVTRISQTDALGHLTSVCEVAPGPFVGTNGASSSSLIGSSGTPAACGQDIAGTGFLTTYQYDALDNLLQVNQAGVTNRTYNYNTLSQLLSVSNPETGMICYGAVSAGVCQGNGYDASGNLVTKTDARGITTTLQYDALNRIVLKTFSDSTPAITNTYDVAVDGLAVNYPVGRLVKSATSNTATVNSYDPMGRVATQWQCTPQNCGSGYFSLPYVYDLMGNITSAGNGMGVTIAYGVDGAAQIASVTSSLLDETHPSVLLSNANYNPFGSMGSSALGNGTSESFAYDSRGRLQNISTNGATPSTGSATVSGSEQSISGPAATSGTGSVTLSGTLQSKQVQTQSATSGAGSVTFNGSLQSWAATPGTGSVTIGGTQQPPVQVCDPRCPRCGCYRTIYNSGGVTVTINGFSKTATYAGAAASSTGIASSLASAFNGDASSPVTASANGSVVTFTSRAAGANTNYSLSTSVTYDSQYFNQAPFTATPSGSSLTGGANAGYDSGSCTITVNSHGDSTTWSGSGTTTSSIASAIASSISGDGGAFVNASPSGSTVSLTARTTGASTNYSLSSSCTYDTSHFSSPSFSTSNSGSALTGGKDAIYVTVYDSGSSTITVNGHPDTVNWSGSGTTSSSIASALASTINADSGASVTASASGSSVNLTARTAGVNTNYSLSSSSSYDSTDFSSPSFSSSNSGSTLTGGQDAGATTYDSGSVWITVNGTQYSISYGQGSTAAALVTSLTQAINGSANSPVTATASSTTVTLVSNEGGPSTNYSLSVGSSTNQSSSFPQPSFTLSVSGSAMTGGGTSGTVYTLALTYAPNGDIASANDSVNGNWGYSYDAFNRLTCSNLASNGSCSIPTSGTPTYSYVYDRFGNRWQQNGPHAFTTSFTGNNSTNNNRMDGYSYDAAGNLLNDGSHQYFYDAENRVIQVDGTLGNCSTATACLVYNAIGQRVQKTTSSGTVNYLYDLAEHQIAETNSSGGWNRGEVYAGDRHLATYVNSTTYFIHPDWLGTERSRTNLNGGLYETCTNLPFGDGFNCSASDISPMHFTGQQHDNESGLDHFEQRKYGSLMGRWTSPDLLPGDQSDPQSLNRYAYARNNPVILIDLFGLQDSFRTGVCGILDDSGTIQPIDCGDLEQLNNLPVNTSDLSAAAQLQPQPEPSQQDLVAGSVTDLTTLAGGGTASTSSTLSGVQTALDLAGVIPFVGDFANAASGMISLSQGHYGAALLSFASALPFAGTAAEAIKIGKLGEEGVQGFKTFRAFKRFYGAAEEGMQWHHIVEQGGGRVARFGPEAIHNVENLVQIPTEIHREISGFYSSSKKAFTDGLTVRQWLKTKSFEEQYQFGRQVLRDFGLH